MFDENWFVGKHETGKEWPKDKEMSMSYRLFFLVMQWLRRHTLCFFPSMSRVSSKACCDGCSLFFNQSQSESHSRDSETTDPHLSCLSRETCHYWMLDFSLGMSSVMLVSLRENFMTHMIYSQLPTKEPEQSCCIWFLEHPSQPSRLKRRKK